MIASLSKPTKPARSSTQTTQLTATSAIVAFGRDAIAPESGALSRRSRATAGRAPVLEPEPRRPSSPRRARTGVFSRGSFGARRRSR